MGYETRLHVGELYTFTPDNTVSQIVTIDLSKAGYTSHTARLLAEARANTAGPFYSVYGEPTEDGDSAKEDCYGEKLTAVDLDRLIEALEKDIKDDAPNPYRRFVLAVKVLKAIRDEPTWRDIRVVQYGY